MENALVEVFDLEAISDDPFEVAVNEAERAIARIRAGESSVDLSPAGSSVRRYQHQLARQANLVSHSYGREPHRHVRIFNTRRNSSTAA
jgi:predicted RNA-binding protein Jag